MREGWKKEAIKEYCEFKYGKNLPKRKRVIGKIPVYGSSGIVDYHKDFLVKGPGIIVGRKGTVGKVNWSEIDFFPIDTTYFINPFLSKVNLKFLYYRLIESNLTDLNSDAAVPGLNRSAAINQTLLFPPLPTQKKIATILSAYDDLIENNLKRIKLLEEMAQITYEEWFVRMRFPGHETAEWDEESGLPVGWERKKLGDFCTKITDGTHDSPKKTKGGIRLVTGKHLSNGFIDFSTAPFISENDHEKIKKRSEVNTGDILFSNIGTLGNTGFIHKESEFSCKNVIIFKRKINCNGFLFTLLDNKNFRKNLESKSVGVAQKFYSLNFIRNFENTFPSDSLVTKFNEKILENINLRFKLHYQNQNLKEARDLLLPRLMSGMIDVDEVKMG